METFILCWTGVVGILLLLMSIEAGNQDKERVAREHRASVSYIYYRCVVEGLLRYEFSNRPNCNYVVYGDIK